MSALTCARGIAARPDRTGRALSSILRGGDREAAIRPEFCCRTDLPGFRLINGFTFFVDLVILTALHSGLGTPLPIAVTVGYACAFALSYFLNRTMNFRSHAPVGPQVAVYVVVVVVNYLAFILGVSTALTAIGVEYHVARIVAGGCEAVYMYSAMRWVVFRR